MKKYESLIDNILGYSVLLTTIATIITIIVGLHYEVDYLLQMCFWVMVAGMMTGILFAIIAMIVLSIKWLKENRDKDSHKSSFKYYEYVVVILILITIIGRSVIEFV